MPDISGKVMSAGRANGRSFTKSKTFSEVSAGQENRSIAKLFYQILIRRQKIEFCQRLRMTPLDLLEHMIPYLGCVGHCGEENQLDRFSHFGILMERPKYLGANSRGDAQFLAQF